MSHANAPLTPRGRLRAGPLRRRGRLAAAPGRRTVPGLGHHRAALGRPLPRSSARPAWSTGPAGPHRSPRRTPTRDRAADHRSCGCSAAGGRPGSPTGSGCTPRPCTGSCTRYGLARLVDRPGHRAGSGPRSIRRYEHDRARRPGPRRHQEARQDPRRRRLAPGSHGRAAGAQRNDRRSAGAGLRATCTTPSTTTPGWPTARSSPTRRKETAAGVLAPRPRLVRRPRHHRRAGAHRQRLLLPLASCAPTPCGDDDHAQADPALPAPDQRQGRTVQPHPARGMGLRPRLPHRSRTRQPPTPRWLHTYNHHRGHTALGGNPPAARVTNLAGQNT